MMKTWFSATFLGILLVVSCKQENSNELMQEVEKKGDKISIPFKKYVLENGLTLIVHEDHSDPVVKIDVTYHVGSAREEIGKSGFAHFFEHMMFEGSEHVKDGEHFKFVTESGGTLNGTTNKDRTNYFETLPSNQLEVGLWLEADRMGFLLNAVTQEKFEIQRETVKNERGQRYDNRPYGLVGEEVAKNLYPYGHPYSWLTIGYIEDLNQVDVDDLKRFFLRWYGPNNAVLTIGGDVDAEEVLELTKKYFGAIPRGPEVNNQPISIPELDTDRYVSKEDRIKMPLFQMVFPSMPRYDDEEYALDCFAEIFGSGQTSILYKNLVKTQKAVNAFAYNATYELSGEMTMGAICKPGTKLDSIENIIRESLLEFEKRGVQKDDVDKFIAQRKSRAIFSLATVSGKVSQLASFQTFTGDANFIAQDLSNLEAVTPEKVMKAYQKYVRGKNCLALSWVPMGQLDLAAAEDNYVIDSSNYIPGADQYADLKERPVRDDLERSKKPASGPNPVVHVPDFWKANFDNGLRIIGTKDDEIPAVSMVLSIDGGHRFVGNPEEKAGLARLTTNLMNESTENHSSEEMAKKLELLGSSVSVSSSMNGVSVSIQSLRENLSETLDLAKEIIFKPAFNEEDFDRLKDQQLQSVKDRENQASAIASVSFSKMLYGSGNYPGNPVSGWENTLTTITRDEVKDYYKTSFIPGNAKLVVVGDIEKEEVLNSVAFLKEWAGESKEVPENAAVPEYDGNKIYLINKEGAAQSEIRIGYYTGIPYDALGEYYIINLTNFPLGGDYNSRINQNLREDKGYTYGARSFFSGDPYGGYFQASSSVKKENTGDAISEFMDEILGYIDGGITEDELRFLKSSIGQREALKYESPFQKARFLSRILQYDLPSDYTDQQNQLLQKISKDELDQAAGKWISPEKFIILVVGDAELVKPQLEDLGKEIVELDMNADPI